MFWFRSNRQKKQSHKQSPKAFGSFGKRRRLSFESLEGRHMLSGVVNVDLAATPGGVHLVGDNSNNAVEVQANPALIGSFVITGTGGTLLQLNGAGQTSPTFTVNNINGDFFVNLGAGSDSSDFEAATDGSITSLPGNLQIVNGNGGNTNTLNNILVNGAVTVDRPAAGTFGSSTLTVTNTTIIGNVDVNNVGTAGGGGGDANTTISSSTLDGLLSIENAAGNAVFLASGSSRFGPGIVPPGAGTVVTIDNGNDVGSSTTFTGTVAAFPTVYGGIDLTNGNALQGFFNIAAFNQTQVLGAVNITNANSDTQVMVQNSGLGTQLNAAGALTVLNGVGFDKFTMTGSNVPAGVEINNNNGAPISNWGSFTSIATSTIGTNPFGPNLSVAGDGLLIRGDNGADTVSVTSSTIGGQMDLLLLNGNNSVTSDSSTMGALNLITGTGQDVVKLAGGSIIAALNISLGSGDDTLNLTKGTTIVQLVLPDPLLGFVAIDAGIGVDTLKHDSNIVLPVNAINFETVTVNP